MRHGDLLIAQTPSREIWFAGAGSPKRTLMGSTGSHHPPWFLQPGWQTAPQSAARSLLMSFSFLLASILSNSDPTDNVPLGLMTQILNSSEMASSRGFYNSGDC